MKYFLLAAFLLIFVNKNLGQNIHDPFIVGVVNTVPNPTVICYGTIISNRQVVTSASCVAPLRTVSVRFLDRFFLAYQVSIHPGFRSGRQGNSNIAVLHVHANFMTQNLPLLPVQNLPSNTTCHLFGWGQQQQGVAPRHISVSIYNSQFCDPVVPGVSCSTFSAQNDETCSALIGSPVICDGNTRFTGIMTSEGCVARQNGFAITYESINIFRTWFNEVIRSDEVNLPSLVANVMEYVAGNVATQRIRCAASIINDNHVLTTASCVALPENSNLVIGVQTHFDGIGFATEQPEDIFTHPNFTAGQTRSSNLAVIRTSRSFMRLSNRQPLNLGSLPTNNATDGHLCQLVRFSGGADHVLNRRVISVYQPQFCHNNLPQVFCSTIDVGSQDTCLTTQGSPVLCGEELTISGIVLNNRECSVAGESSFLDFHSVNQFREWIDEVSGAGKLAKMSTLLILAVLLINAKNLL